MKANDQLPRIACVVQRYGLDVGGGSEELCRAVAEHLTGTHDVEVLTTCARDYVTWSNELQDGDERLNGVLVRRFKVDAPRHQAEFDRISERLFGAESSHPEEEERWMRAQGPFSASLFDFIGKSADRYDAFLFFTYLYGTTYYGLQRVADKSVLVPTAHDEPPIYLSIFDRLFALPRRMLFLTPEERNFVLRRFCLPEESGEVAGVGLDVKGMVQPAGPLEAEMPETVLSRLGSDPYILYVGRIDEGKGCHVLIDWFRSYAAEHPQSRIQLVLAGRAAMAVPNHPRIIATGYLSESQKRACMDHALAIVAPSPYESLCIAALEAWLRQRPVLANGNCAVLVGQCQRSAGGLWYRNVYEFAECLNALATNSGLRERLGASGYDYVLRTYCWDKVEKSYVSAIRCAAGFDNA